MTPIHRATSHNRLTRIPGLTVGIVQEQGVGVFTAALRPENIHCLADDLRTTGHRFNKPSKVPSKTARALLPLDAQLSADRDAALDSGNVRKALLRCARLLPQKDPTINAGIRKALTAAVEGGFELPPELLAKLL